MRVQDSTYVISDSVITEKTDTKKVFVETQLIESAKTKKADIEKVNNITPDWILYLIIVLLASLAWIRVFYSSFLTTTLRSVINYQLSQNIYSDPGIVTKRLRQFLLFFYFFSVGLWLYLVFTYFNLSFFELSNVSLFFALLASIIVLYLLRTIIMRLTGYIFSRQSLYNEYLFHHFLINKVFGLAVLPFLLAIAYSKEPYTEIMVWTSIGIFIIALIMRVIVAISYIFRNVVSKFYLILYLCTLEILPVLVIVRVIISLL